MTVVRQRYGTAVMAEVLEESVNAATQQVLTDRGLRAASQPKVDVDASSRTSRTCEFTVELELLPEIADARFRRHRADPAEGDAQRRGDRQGARARSPAGSASSSRSPRTRRRSRATC